MDEPLSNLDAKLRVHMRTELAELHARLGVTMIYVTHDQVEAMTMADRLAVMDHGEILQLGTPSEVYERPASITVAQFIGSPGINLLRARVATTGRSSCWDRRSRCAYPRRAAPRLRSACARRRCAWMRGRAIARCRAGSDGARTWDRRASCTSTWSAPEPVPMLCKVGHEQYGWFDPSDGQTMLAISPESCHFFDDAWQRRRASSHGDTSCAVDGRPRDLRRMRQTPR